MVGRKREKRERRKKEERDERGKRKEWRMVPKFTFLPFSFTFVPRARQSSQKDPKQNLEESLF